MSWISVALSICLMVISALHALWALGSPWPMKSGQELVNAVVGAENRIDMPPKWQSALVALLLLAAAMWPHVMEKTLVIPFLPPMLIALGGWTLTAVFIGRGLIGLTPWFHKLLPEEPFRTYNRNCYSPLCIVIGAGFLVLQTP